MTDPRVPLHADLRRAHSHAAKALNAVAGHYRDDPRTLASLVEATQILHAIMERAESIIRDDLDADARRRPAPPPRTPEARDPDPAWRCPRSHPRHRYSRRGDGRTYCLECMLAARRGAGATGRAA